MSSKIGDPIYDESGFPVGTVVSEVSGSELRERWEKDRETPIPIPRHVHKNFNDPAQRNTVSDPTAAGYQPLSNLCRHGLAWPGCKWCHSTETLREDQRKAQLDRIEAKLDSVEGHLVTMMAQMALLLNEVCKRPEPPVQDQVNRFLKWVPSWEK